MEFFKHLLSAGFMPHGYCYLWDPWMVWMNVISDVLITLSYYCIPVVLVYFIRKRRDLPCDWIFWMFGAFILACGTTHLMEVWNIWHASYLLAGIVKATTAGVSVVTAVRLVPLLPKAVSVPSLIHLQKENQKLEQQIAERKRRDRGIVEAPLRRRVIVGLVAAVLLTAGMGFLSWRTTRQAAREADLVAHTYAVMDALEVTLEHCTQMVASARGFALTGNSLLLVRYEAVRSTIAQDETAIARLTADNPDQQPRLHAVEGQVNATSRFVQNLVIKRRTLQTVPGEAEVLESERLMAAVRDAIDSMRTEEARLLSQRTERTSSARRLTGFVTVLGTLFGVSFLVFAGLAINQEINFSGRVRAEINVLNAGLEERVEQRTAALQSEIAEREQAEEALKNSLATSDRALKEPADQKFALDQHAIVAVTDVQGTIMYVRTSTTSSAPSVNIPGTNSSAKITARASGSCSGGKVSPKPAVSPADAKPESKPAEPKPAGH